MTVKLLRQAARTLNQSYETNTVVNTVPIKESQSRTFPQWIKLLSTFVVLALLTWQIQWQDVLNALKNASLIGLSGAIALWIPNQYLQYLRWKLIANSGATKPYSSDIKASYWLGHTLGFITPGRIGAYGRGLFLRNVNVLEATALTFLERSYSAVTVNGFGLIALGLLPQLGWSVSWAPLSPSVSFGLTIVGGLVLAAGLVPGAILGFIGKTLGTMFQLTKVANSLQQLNLISFRTSFLFLGLASLSLLVSLVQFYLILRAFGVELSFIASLLAIQLNFFLKGNIPLTLGNLGVGEWTALICLRGLGVPDTISVAASLALFSLNVAIPALVGVRFIKRIFTIHHGWQDRV